MAAFRLQCFRSLWGTPSAARLRVPAGEKPHVYGGKLLEHIRSQGYDGIEASLSDLDAIGGLKQVSQMLDENELKLIVGVYSGWVDYEDANLDQQFDSVKSHLKRYREQLEQIYTVLPGSSKGSHPVWINAHSGADRWGKVDQMEFLAHALEIEKQFGCDRLSHETHRGRIFYSPWPTLELLEAFPSLKLTLDFSHWCVVSERLLDTEKDEEWIERVLPHVHHVHGRIGTVQTAQLTHPKEAFSQREIERFERLWSSIWRHQHDRYQEALALGGKGNDIRPFSTFTPEYGPIPYAPRHHENLETEAYDVDVFCAEQAARERQRFDQAIKK